MILNEEADETLSHSPPGVVDDYEFSNDTSLFIMSFKCYITFSSRLFRNRNETPVRESHEFSYGLESK